MDTATPAVTAGVVALEPGRLETLAERITLDARAHGELLTPHVLDAATAAGIGLREVDAIVCGAGPGPYTGLRAGMATAGALAHAVGIPAYPVCSLDAIARDVSCAEPFLVVTDARRREVYLATYGANGTRMDGPRVVRPGDVRTDVTVAAGHGATQHAAELGTRVLGPEYPSPAGLVATARDAVLARAAPEPLTPLYLRRPHVAEPGSPKRVSTP